MAEQSPTHRPALSEFPQEKLALVYDKLCDRRESTNVLLWQVPALSLTAQAFLLSVTLDGSVSELGRTLTALIGLVAALGTLHLFGRHRQLEVGMSRKLEQLERAAGFPDMHKLGVHTSQDPPRFPKSARRLEKSSFVWTIVLSVIAAVDALILVLSLVALLSDYSPLTLLVK